jgi:hypothetical protein
MPMHRNHERCTKKCSISISSIYNLNGYRLIKLHLIYVSSTLRTAGWRLSSKECSKVMHVIKSRGHSSSFFSFFLWRNSPQWARASSFLRFLDHIQRTTVGRTPLDEWSAHRKDLYLTTHNIHNRHPCPRRDSNPQSQQASGRRPTP